MCVGGMVAKASSLGSDLVVDYTICHHNWQYDFLLPSEVEIVSAYQLLYGGGAHPSDVVKPLTTRLAKKTVKTLTTMARRRMQWQRTREQSMPQPEL